MRNNSDSELFTRVCKLCGRHIRSGVDHSKCSKIKQKKFQEESKNKKNKKILTKKNIEYLTHKFRN